MSASVYDLIGQIINPGPMPRTTLRPQASGAPAESVHTLIGRIISPPGVTVERADSAPAGADEPGLVIAPPAV